MHHINKGFIQEYTSELTSSRKYFRAEETPY